MENFSKKTLTDLIHFDDVEFCAHFAQEGFGGAAVGAVGLGKDGFFAMVKSQWIIDFVGEGKREGAGTYRQRCHR